MITSLILMAGLLPHQALAQDLIIDDPYNTIWSGDHEFQNIIVGNSGQGSLRITAEPPDNRNPPIIPKEETHVVVLESLVMGSGAGSSGEVYIGGIWSGVPQKKWAWVDVVGPTVIGDFGKGTLVVMEGGTLINYNSVTLGRQVGSEGTLRVYGYWAGGAAVVGDNGTGTLVVEQQSEADGTFTIGKGSSGTGTMVVGGHLDAWGLSVGYYGTGTLSIEAGGDISSKGSGGGYIGDLAGSNGSATVRGAWVMRDGTLNLGNNGTGTLNIESGGVVSAPSVYIGAEGGSVGTLNLNDGGTLIAGGIAKGSGTASVKLDGGTLRATGNNNNYLSNFAPGDVTIKSGGAFIDTNGFSVGIAASLEGSGALVKRGGGTLTLSASNSFTGGTVIEAGTLTAAHDTALGTGSVTVKGGTFSIQTGVNPANAIILNGGNVARVLGSGASLANTVNVSTTLGGKTTGAAILDGTTSKEATVQASFSITSNADNDDVRLSSVLSLTGVPVVNITGETDRFVLQLQMTKVTEGSLLAWLNPKTNLWVNAIEGNIGGFANFVGNRAYDAETDFILGTYGIDILNGTVWAVLDHHSDFAIANLQVPEPGTWALVVLGAGAVLHLTRKRRSV